MMKMDCGYNFDCFSGFAITEVNRSPVCLEGRLSNNFKLWVQTGHKLWQSCPNLDLFWCWTALQCVSTPHAKVTFLKEDFKVDCKI